MKIDGMAKRIEGLETMMTLILKCNILKEYYLINI